MPKLAVPVDFYLALIGEYVAKARLLEAELEAAEARLRRAGIDRMKESVGRAHDGWKESQRSGGEAGEEEQAEEEG